MMHGDAIDTHSLLFWFCGMIVEEVEVVGELFFMVKETKRKIKLKKQKREMKEGGGDGQVWEQDKSSLGCKRMYKYCKLGRRCDARQAQQLWE